MIRFFFSIVNSAILVEKAPFLCQPFQRSDDDVQTSGFMAFSPQISSARQKVLISELNSRFRAMVGQVDGLLKAEVGQNLASNSEYHMILYTVFTSRKAMEAYQKHPLHLAVKKEMETIVCDRLPMDYEV